MKNVIIKIENKRAYAGSAEKHPYGDFYVDGGKFTCWDEALFDKFNIGDVVEITYTEKSNESNGKVYINKNISTIKYAYNQEDERTVYEDMEDDIINNMVNDYEDDTNYITYPPSELRAGNVVISGNVYEVVLRMVGNGK